MNHIINRPRNTVEIKFLSLVIILLLVSTPIYSVFPITPAEATSTISARIDSYYPSDPNNPAVAAVGDSVIIGVTFTNTGDTAWNFIAGASVWDSSNITVGDYEKILDTALQPGQQTTVSWNHPITEVGDFRLQFGIWKEKPYISANLLDKAPSPYEWLIVGTGPLPDLTVTPVSFTPSSACIGENISISSSLRNQGGVPSGLFYYRVSLGTTLWGRQYSLGNFQVDPLGAGESQAIAAQPTIPLSVPAPADYYVTVYADSFKDIVESDEDNNIGSSAPLKINICSQNTVTSTTTATTTQSITTTVTTTTATTVTSTPPPQTVTTTKAQATLTTTAPPQTVTTTQTETEAVGLPAEVTYTAIAAAIIAAIAAAILYTRKWTHYSIRFEPI